MNATLYCNQCGNPNTAGAQFCSRCGTSLNPASPSAVTTSAAAPVPVSPVAYPPASYAAQPGVRYGGFWIRFIALIIDSVLIRVVIFPIGAVFGLGGLALGGFGHGGFGLMHLLGGGVIVLLTIVGSWLYEAAMESSSYQATLGKMIFGMKVTDLHGNRISFGRATGRHFAKIISGMLLCVGFIMAGFTERKQALHDLLAGTLVRIS